MHMVIRFMLLESIESEIQGQRVIVISKINAPKCAKEQYI
jgi:hypothetical protein